MFFYFIFCDDDDHRASDVFGTFEEAVHIDQLPSEAKHGQYLNGRPSGKVNKLKF